MPDGLGEQTHRGAVARRLRVEPAHRRDAAAARPMLHDDVRIARNEPLQMVGGEPRIEIVRAAGRMAEHDGDGLAFVKFRG